MVPKAQETSKIQPKTIEGNADASGVLGPLVLSRAFMEADEYRACPVCSASVRKMARHLKRVHRRSWLDGSQA